MCRSILPCQAAFVRPIFCSDGDPVGQVSFRPGPTALSGTLSVQPFLQSAGYGAGRFPRTEPRPVTVKIEVSAPDVFKIGMEIKHVDSQGSQFRRETFHCLSPA